MVEARRECRKEIVTNRVNSRQGRSISIYCIEGDHHFIESNVLKNFNCMKLYSDLSWFITITIKDRNPMSLSYVQ